MSLLFPPPIRQRPWILACARKTEGEDKHNLFSVIPDKRANKYFFSHASGFNDQLGPWGECLKKLRFFSLHAPGLLPAPLMVISGQVQDAVNQ